MTAAATRFGAALPEGGTIVGDARLRREARRARPRSGADGESLETRPSSSTSRIFEPPGVSVLDELPLGRRKHPVAPPLGVTATPGADARSLTIDHSALADQDHQEEAA